TNILLLVPEVKSATVPNSIKSYTTTPGQKNATMGFVTTNATSAYFEVQNSLEGGNWTSAAIVPGSGSTNFSTSLSNPKNGANRYRLVLYDKYFNESFSPVIAFNVKESATLTSFTAAGNSSKITLTLKTASEFMTGKFYIAKKTDNTDWALLSTINAAGTTNTPQTYTADDEAPVAGKNYYVLIYNLKGVKTYSAIQVVDLSPSSRKQNDAVNSSDIVVTAYPNPTTDNIAFGLKNYAGKTLDVTVTNIYGKLVAKELLLVNSSEYYILKNRTLPGTYIVSIQGEGLAKATKVIVNNK
ncbi:MAG: T9SS type A sorting domain-containing protein, partial [Sphingobacteriaceae bacterium]